MSIYDDMQEIATNLLGDFDQGKMLYVEMLVGTSGPVYNPTPLEPRIHNITSAVARGVEYKYVDGSQIVSTDGQIICAVDQSFTPNIKDYVSVGGKRCKIKKAGHIPPTGTPVSMLIIYEG